MAVDYMIRENAWFNYLTPVLGPPWQVPMEFPLYQMIVAGLCLILDSPIDQTGRALSLLFFYASLLPMNVFLKRIVPEQKYRFMILSLVLVSPLYIYFSRAVMIESSALFFGFLFLTLCSRQFVWPNAFGIGALLICGSLCALVKITTFCAFCFPCLIIPLWEAWNRQGFGFLRDGIFWKGILVFFTPSFGVPLTVGVIWTFRADQIKGSSPATVELTSSSLHSWNFGTWGQRLEPEAWFDLAFKWSFGLTFFPLLIAFFAMIFFVKPDVRRAALLLLWAAALPALVFFNLHVVHDYYFYASSVFTLFALGLLLAGLMREGNIWAKPVWLALILSMIAMYGSFFSKSSGKRIWK